MLPRVSRLEEPRLKVDVAARSDRAVELESALGLDPALVEPAGLGPVFGRPQPQP